MVDRKSFEKIKSRIDILEVISDFFEVSQSYDEYFAYPPLSLEDDQAIVITPKLGKYKCKRTGKTGNAFHFLVEYMGMSMTDAFQYLNNKYLEEHSKPKELTTERGNATNVQKSSYDPINFHVRTLLEKNKSLKWDIGFKTGLSALDNILTGFKPGMLYFVGGRPGMGVSAFVYSIIKHVTFERKRPSCIFSSKATSWNIINRFIAAEVEIEIDALRKIEHIQIKAELRKEFLKKIKQTPLYIDADDNISVGELKQRAILLGLEHGVQLIVIDGIESWEEHQIVGLKNLAVDIDVPIIITATLDRILEESGGDKKPQLSDLRTFGGIEQYLDVVMFVYRAEYYGITEYEDGSPTKGLMEVLVEKNRFGYLDTILLKFIGKYGKVEECEI